MVLCFHDVGRSGRYAIPLADFTEILDELRPFRVVSLKDWVDAKNTEDARPRVVLTFDDGYAAHRELVLPELMRRGFGGTFYFYADQISRDKAWVEIARDHHEFDFGSHSWSHALLRDTGYDALFKELYLARSFIEDLLGQKVESFAWPYGYYDASGLDAARNAGFGYQVSVDYRVASRSDIAGVIPRYTIFGKQPLEQVRQILGDYLRPKRASSDPARHRQ